MALFYAQINTATGAIKRVPLLYTDTSATSAGQVDFSVSGLTASNLVEAWMNGIPQVEGVTDDFQRNVAGNKITLNASVPANAVVKVRIWS